MEHREVSQAKIFSGGGLQLHGLRPTCAMTTLLEGRHVTRLCSPDHDFPAGRYQQDYLVLWRKLWLETPSPQVDLCSPAQLKALRGIGSAKEDTKAASEEFAKLARQPEAYLSNYIETSSTHDPPPDPALEPKDNELDSDTERYIDLRKHPELAINKLRSIFERGTYTEAASFLVRRECTRLAKCIFSNWPWQPTLSQSPPPFHQLRYYLWTGQPGIGTSVIEQCCRKRATC